MKCSGQHLLTPVYLKLHESMPWPQQEAAFYLLSRDGLFLCRNSPFFRSCVPVENYPSELASQRPFLKLGYPKIPQSMLEQIVGFFDLINQRYASEAAVLLVWNRMTQAMEVLVPDQIGWVAMSWNGKPYPMTLEYKVPSLESHLLFLGDIHSHADGNAFASSLDKSDERHCPGLHLVIGRILDEPPQMHCDATVDGLRFHIHDLNQVLEGYDHRRVHEVPQEWIDKVTIASWHSHEHGQCCGHGQTVSGLASATFEDGGGVLSKPGDYTQDNAFKAKAPVLEKNDQSASAGVPVAPTDLGDKESRGPSDHLVLPRNAHAAPRPPGSN